MIDYLNNDKFFLGMMLMILNIGSRYLVDEFSANPEEYTQNLILRRLAVFAVCFVGTRDVVTSLLLTGGFIIIAQGVSRANREGMANKQAIEKAEKKVDQPAATDDKPMFVDTMDPHEPAVGTQ
jgi:hypothetical protein